MPERIKGLPWKGSGHRLVIRGFESHSIRHLEGKPVGYGHRLESGWGAKLGDRDLCLPPFPAANEAGRDEALIRLRGSSPRLGAMPA